MIAQKNIILSLKDVKKRFGGLMVINNVSLDVRKGEIMGLIGPNASGKTTIVNLITGIYRIDSGGIFYSGDRIDGLQANTLASKGIMRTFQISRVFHDMSVLENMMVPALSQGQSMEEAQSIALELLEFGLLFPLKDEPAKNLSGGQNMLLQIVRGFMNKNLSLYLMDEPFAGVHQSIKGIIINAIKKMNSEKGITFLIVSHEMTTINALCSQVSVMHKGEIISKGTMDQVASDPLVIDAYLGG
jgi:branched-chain amino acid transport system ATP-binding protein